MVMTFKTYHGPKDSGDSDSIRVNRIISRKAILDPHKSASINYIILEGFFNQMDYKENYILIQISEFIFFNWF